MVGGQLPQEVGSCAAARMGLPHFTRLPIAPALRQAGPLGAGFMATADLCDPPGKEVVPRRVRVREAAANGLSNNSLFTPMSDSPRGQKLPRLPQRK
jgi:hypothetical protein